MLRRHNISEAKVPFLITQMFNSPTAMRQMSSPGFLGVKELWRYFSILTFVLLRSWSLSPKDGQVMLNCTAYNFNTSQLGLDSIITSYISHTALLYNLFSTNDINSLNVVSLVCIVFFNPRTGFALEQNLSTQNTHIQQQANLQNITHFNPLGLQQSYSFTHHLYLPKTGSFMKALNCVDLASTAV